MALSTPTLIKKKNVFAAIAVVSLLLLTTGCGEDEKLAQGGGSGSSSDGSGNSDSKDKDGDGKDDASKDAPVVILEGKDCFPGNWLVDNTDIQKYMEAVSGGAKISTTGSVYLAYNADGTSVTNYDHWTNTITLEGATSVVERNGIDQGTYTASNDGTFTGSDTSIGSVTSMTVTGPGGQTIAMSVDPEPSVFDTGQYTCSGDVLTMVVDGYNLSLARQ